jgi:hypothetical protein
VKIIIFGEREKERQKCKSIKELTYLMKASACYLISLLALREEARA